MSYKVPYTNMQQAIALLELVKTGAYGYNQRLGFCDSNHKFALHEADQRVLKELLANEAIRIIGLAGRVEAN